MDWGNLAQWGALGISVLALLRSFVNERDKQSAEAIANVMKKSLANGERIDRHETRILSIEGDMRHLPSKDAVSEMKLAMARLEGQMGIIVERVGPIKAIADRVQEAWLEHAK